MWLQRNCNPQLLSSWTNTQLFSQIKANLAKWLSVRYKLSGCGFKSRCSHLKVTDVAPGSSKEYRNTLKCSPRNYRQQKAIAAEIAFHVKIILYISLFSLKYNNKKNL